MSCERLCGPSDLLADDEGDKSLLFLNFLTILQTRSSVNCRQRLRSSTALVIHEAQTNDI